MTWTGLWIPVTVLQDHQIYFQAEANSQHSPPLCCQGSLGIPPTHGAANVSVDIELSPGDHELLEGKDSFRIPSIPQSLPSVKRSVHICRMNKPLSFPGCLAGTFTDKQVGHRKNLPSRHLGSMKADFFAVLSTAVPWNSAEYIQLTNICWTNELMDLLHWKGCLSVLSISSDFPSSHTHWPQIHPLSVPSFCTKSLWWWPLFSFLSFT